ncbi:MAG: phenylalanine--tRNA ligase alpha subunit [Candidatus Sericytochromatia bacterium]|nr:MAG: phenylalanine--tRNA ligase alpha subunit [Candidatus Sericytochromatia bacterium]
MEENLLNLKNKAIESIRLSKSKEEVNQLRIKYLGKKGEITSILKTLGSLQAEERASLGKLINQIKNEVEEFINKRFEEIDEEVYEKIKETEWIDITAPGKSILRGRLHPITQIQYEIEDIFKSMGFSIFEGPELEDDYHNFEALNIPFDHPARDMQDTFWLENDYLLRTHTSSVQIRTLETLKPPLQGISPGRVFRYEATDASHENTFYQVEGLMVGKDISVANLIYVMKVLLKEIFKKEVKIRLRPGFFPFVEPGFELDINCLICNGKGCSVCKHTGWVELLPCGLVHPNVLKMQGIDTEKYSGFAFGLGLNRLVMMRYGIDDIRHFLSSDLRFLEQF